MSHHPKRRRRRLLGVAVAFAAATALTPAVASAQDEPTTAPTCGGQTTLTAYSGYGVQVECPDATSVRVLSRPSHGRLDTYADDPRGGYGRYHATNGYAGADAFTIRATNAQGSADITIDVEVAGDEGPPPCNTGEGVSSVRANGARTIYVSCQGPRDLTASAPQAGGVTAGSISVGPPEFASAFGQSAYGYPVTFRPEGVDVGASVTSELTVSGVDDPIDLKFNVVGDDVNTAPACNAANNFGNGGPFQDTAAAGMTLPIIGCLDAEGDPVELVKTAGAGTLSTLGTSGGIYTVPSVPGPDSVSVTATDRPPAGLQRKSATVSVLLTVQAPRCTPTTLSVAPDGVVTQTIRCDGTMAVFPVDITTLGVFSSAAHGSVDVTPDGPGTWDLTYTPDKGFSGTDSFLLATQLTKANPSDDDRFERTNITVTVANPPVPQPPAQPQPQPQPPAPPVVVSEKDRILALIKGTGLKAVMKSVRAALAKNKAKASIKALPYDAVIAVKLTAKVGKKQAVKQGSGSLNAFQNRKGTLKLSLTKAAKKTLKRKRKLKVTVQLTMTNPDTGAKATLKQSVTIKAPKPKKRRKK